MSTTAVSWRRTPETSRALRLTVYAAVGSLVGPAVALVGAAATVLFRMGSVEMLILVVVVALVGLALVNRGALLAVRSDEVSGAQFHRDTRALSRRALVAAVAVGGAGATAVLRIEPSAVVLLFASGFGWLLVGSLLRTEGEVTDGALRVAGRTVPLAALADVRRVQVGPRVWLWQAYEPGSAGAMAPRVVSVPVEVAGAVDAACERGVERDPETDGRQPSTPVRVVAVAFGLAFLAAGPVLWVALPAGEGTTVALYAGSIGGLFGVVFLWYALVG